MRTVTTRPSIRAGDPRADLHGQQARPAHRAEAPAPTRCMVPAAADQDGQLHRHDAGPRDQARSSYTVQVPYTEDVVQTYTVMNSAFRKRRSSTYTVHGPHVRSDRGQLTTPCNVPYTTRTVVQNVHGHDVPFLRGQGQSTYTVQVPYTTKSEESTTYTVQRSLHRDQVRAVATRLASSVHRDDLPRPSHGHQAYHYESRTMVDRPGSGGGALGRRFRLTAAAAAPLAVAALRRAATVPRRAATRAAVAARATARPARTKTVCQEGLGPDLRDQARSRCTTYEQRRPKRSRTRYNVCKTRCEHAHPHGATSPSTAPRTRHQDLQGHARCVLRDPSEDRQGLQDGSRAAHQVPTRSARWSRRPVEKTVKVCKMRPRDAHQDLHGHTSACPSSVSGTVQVTKCRSERPAPSEVHDHEVRPRDACTKEVTYTESASREQKHQDLRRSPSYDCVPETKTSDLHRPACRSRSQKEVPVTVCKMVAQEVTVEAPSCGGGYSAGGCGGSACGGCGAPAPSSCGCN